MSLRFFRNLGCARLQQPHCVLATTLRRSFVTNPPSNRSSGTPNNSAKSTSPNKNGDSSSTQQRLSKILAQAKNWTLSRREAERLVRGGHVTLAGKVIEQPHMLLSAHDISALRLNGKVVQVPNNTMAADGTTNDATDDASTKTRVWLVHKVVGELVADHDPQNRPLLIPRLLRAGVGRVKGSKKHQQQHIKAVGRLDMSTQGLIIVTNDGAYAREMELPSSALHRTYKVRVHGLLHEYKLSRIQKGMSIDNVYYQGMKVQVDRPKRSKAASTNQWITLTCVEGKNRQIRNVLQHLGCK